MKLFYILLTVWVLLSILSFLFMIGVVVFIDIATNKMRKHIQLGDPVDIYIGEERTKATFVKRDDYGNYVIRDTEGMLRKFAERDVYPVLSFRYKKK